MMAESTGTRKWEDITPLDNIGAAMRQMTLKRNRWEKNRAYSKHLIETEYEIQQEFKLS